MRCTMLFQSRTAARHAGHVVTPAITCGAPPPVPCGLALVSLAHSHTSPSLFYNYTHVAARESSVCRRYVATIVLSSPHGL